MKNFGLLIFAAVVLCSVNVFADNNSTPCQKPCNTPKTCEKKMYTRPCPVDKFLCTGKDKDKLYKCIGLSNTQICTADKINDKYEMEVLSINEKIKCENKRLYDLKQNCMNKSEYREVKKNLKELKRERKKICKCYENQFKEILSDNQKREYKKYKKQQ